MLTLMPTLQGEPYQTANPRQVMSSSLLGDLSAGNPSDNLWLRYLHWNLNTSGRPIQSNKLYIYASSCTPFVYQSNYPCQSTLTIEEPNRWPMTPNSELEQNTLQFPITIKGRQLKMAPSNSSTSLPTKWRLTALRNPFPRRNSRDSRSSWACQKIEIWQRIH
jgi:hypothetical protein